MAYVYESTYGGNIQFGLRTTRKEAVTAALESIADGNGDGYFWASEDGENIEGTGAALDFTVVVYDSVPDALAAQRGLDDFAMPDALRALAEAIEEFYEAE